MTSLLHSKSHISYFPCHILKAMSARPVQDDTIRARGIIMQINPMPRVRLNVRLNTATPIEPCHRNTILSEEACAVTSAENEILLAGEVEHRPGKVRRRNR